MIADEWADDFIVRTERRCRQYRALHRLQQEARDLIPSDEHQRREYDEETERLLVEIRASGVHA